MNPLGAAQLEQYERDGFLLFSGLIPDAIITRARSAMWECMGLDPDDAASWPPGNQGVKPYDHPALLDCYTPALLEAAAFLSGVDPSRFRAPARAHSINVFPTPGEWRIAGRHLDHSLKGDNYRTFPRAFHIAAMAYLSDGEPHGASTVVWPGSHTLMRQLAESRPEEYDTMWKLNNALKETDAGEPREIIARSGDVLFYQYLTVHSGSTNTGAHPRLALNMKWQG